MAPEATKSLHEKFAYRFGDPAPAHEPEQGGEVISFLAGRRVCRKYSDRPVDPALIETICAAALCAPTKSDLQQGDIVIVTDPAVRKGIDELFSEDSWIRTAPVFLVFCGNNRRQRQIHEWRGREFANDHLDAFFNAAVDAAIVLGAFEIAAESAGLGVCPISEVRNHAPRVSDLLELPDHVFPLAGMTLGWPADEGTVSLRLPLSVTVHKDRFSEDGLKETIGEYDKRRAQFQPYAYQRFADQFGEQDDYGWSEEKARQYTEPQRADFGAFIRGKGFRLD
jgi:nitroreductase/FMN reductase [NAD(P)H]